MKLVKSLISLVILIAVGFGIYWFISQGSAAKLPSAVATNQKTDQKNTQSQENKPTSEQKSDQKNEEKPNPTSQPSSTQDQNSTLASQKTTQNTTNSVSAPQTEVTTYQISKDQKSYLDLLGTVKAQNQVKIYGQTTGQLAKINFATGDYVKKGDILFELKGQNGSEHQTETQLKIAQTNYNTARQALENTAIGNDSALRLAQLQLQSAVAQADASNVDLKVYDQNISGGRNNLTILQDSLKSTREKNSLDLEKAKRSIDDLSDAISKLNDQKYRLLNTADSQPSSQTTDVNTAISEIDKKLEDLYTQFENAKTGYKTLVEGADLSENQIEAQIKQAQNQVKVLELNQQSLEDKLGLGDGVADSVSLAEEGLSAAQVKNNVALSQAQAQLNLAKLNLDLAKAQTENLKITAPVSGILDKISLSIGDLVTPQVSLSQIVDTQNFELEVSIGVDDAEKVKLHDLAEIKIGDRFMEVPIKNISPVADPNSKLVTVTLGLPKINFKANQTLVARMGIYPNAQVSENPGHYYIPLDAVIIGSEEQYVFVAQTDPQTGETKAHKVTVKLGEISGDKVQVIEGIQKADQVIVQGAKELIDGQSVKLPQTQNASGS